MIIHAPPNDYAGLTSKLQKISPIPDGNEEPRSKLRGILSQGIIFYAIRSLTP